MFSMTPNIFKAPIVILNDKSFRTISDTANLRTTFPLDPF